MVRIDGQAVSTTVAGDNLIEAAARHAARRLAGSHDRTGSRTATQHDGEGAGVVLHHGGDRLVQARLGGTAFTARAAAARAVRSCALDAHVYNIGLDLSLEHLKRALGEAAWRPPLAQAPLP